MGIKKPPICQAGSAEAFVDSTATGREHNKLYTFRSVQSRKKTIRKLLIEYETYKKADAAQ